MAGTYRQQPVKRVGIPYPDGGFLDFPSCFNTLYV